MFEKAIEALQAIARELKRYNDRRDATAPVDATPAKDTAEAPATPKATPVAAKPVAAAKPAAKPAAKAQEELTLVKVQEAAVEYSKKGRDVLIATLKKAGVPGVDNGAGKLVYKVSNVADDPIMLAKVYEALTADSGAEDDPTA
jgi:hypothetical protein